MATQTIEFGAPAGQTVTARLFAAGSDTVVATATATARTNATGIYTAAFTNLTPGLYRLIGTNAAGTLLCQWWTLTESATATYQAHEVPPSIVADAVWDEAYSQHTTAGTFGKLMDTLRKSNTVLEGTILASPTPTTTVFRVSGIDFPTGALEHAILWMNSGTSENQNSPILTTVNNGDGTVTVTLEEALVTAPVAGDTVLIDPTSHVHAIVDIQGTMPDRLGYLLAILAGTISDAGTAAETYTITLGASTFTVDYSGLDATGNRTGATLSKT
jgi:hypothetical protein